MDHSGAGIPGDAPAPFGGPAEGEDFSATSGDPLAEGVAVAGEDAVIEAMKTVYDPEIPVNIYDLGLIYEIKIDDKGEVKIDMSLTAPGCPVAGDLPGWVADAVA